MNREKPFTEGEPNESREFAYMGMPEGGRGLDEYEQKLLFDRHELQGKKVLDLGAGPHAKLAAELKDSGISAEVISLSPEYAIEKFSDVAREKTKEGQLVAGKGETLPFREGAFDVIFAFHIDEHIGGRQNYFKIISEMGRVLKPGGYAKYGPTYVIPNEWDPYKELIKNDDLMRELRGKKIQVEHEEVPESIIRKQKIKDEYANAFYVPARHIILRRAARGGDVHSGTQ